MCDHPCLRYCVEQCPHLKKKGILEVFNKDEQMYGKTFVNQSMEWVKTLQARKEPTCGVSEGA